MVDHSRNCRQCGGDPRDLTCGAGEQFAEEFRPAQCRVDFPLLAGENIFRTEKHDRQRRVIPGGRHITAGKNHGQKRSENVETIGNVHILEIAEKCLRVNPASAGRMFHQRSP